MKALLAVFVFYFAQYIVSSEPIAYNRVSYVPLTPSESYTHFEYVDENNKDQYRLFWKLLVNDEIQFEVHVKTTGWVGLGISPNGGMAGNVRI